jgi:Nicotinamide mononucleotide adenylyltransferase
MNGLLIGRFQPFHLGHLEALQFALSKVDKLWVGLGSSNKPTEKIIHFLQKKEKK